MEFEITMKSLAGFKASIRESPVFVYRELEKAIKISINIIRPMMRQQAPTKTGKLSRNIYAHSYGLTGEVGPNLDITKYAYWVEHGTSPYIIRPKTKKALYWTGAEHPWSMVHHPGIKANPFIVRTYEEMKDPVRRIFKDATERIVKDIIS